VRKAYPFGDLFVDTSRIVETKDAIERFVALIFGDPWRTPSRDEQGMAFAYLASVRSGSPARQVGAALIDDDGNLIAVGCNEVAKPLGGQYWEEDDNDGRDFRYGSTDLSDKMRKNLLADVLRRLQKLNVLGEDQDPARLLDPDSESYTELREAQLFDTIDFVRAVHAEAATLLAAHGRTRNCSLLVTTFPCHECARHIVASGVRRVVYVEPYPKSLVGELYKDSIAVDQDGPRESKVEFKPFTGVSPTVYQHLFQLTKDARKDKHGTLKVWNASQAIPCLHVFYSEPAVVAAEAEVLAQFEFDMRAREIPYESIPGTT
jgi:cytidine deaminase